MAIVLFIAGLVFLIVGAEALVRGASRLAAAFGISPLVIGLTVVAFGTSSPELAVSTKAALAGQAEIAVGNVIGSNIFNVLFILGISALIVPLVVSRQLIRLDVPLMILLSVAVLLLALDGRIGRLDGLLLFGGLLAYIGFLIRAGRRERVEAAAGEDREEERASGVGPARNVAMVVVGLALLVLGSRWLVNGAVAFAEYLGISQLIIGLTIIAAGTSLPEVVTSIVAAVRGERDIAVGNVVGSNLFNIMGVLGIAAIVAPAGIDVSPAVIGFDMPVMIAVAFACLPVFFTGGVISRAEGTLLFGYYLAYTLFLVLAASQHDALAGFSAGMLYFVVPLTVAGLAFTAWNQFRRAGRATH